MSTRFLSEIEIKQVIEDFIRSWKEAEIDTTAFPRGTKEYEERIKKRTVPFSADRRGNGLSVSILEQEADIIATILRTVKIVPEEINNLGYELARSFIRAGIDAGTTVGTLAAQATGEPATQGKLKNFSNPTGSLKAKSYNADRINEILGVIGTQRYRNMTIVFEDKNITYEEVLLKYRPKIVGMTLDRIVTDYSLMDVRDESFNELRKEWWETFFYIYGIDPSGFSSSFLRLQIDVKKAAKYKITMPMISKSIRSGNNGSFLAVIFSPFHIGTIDLFVLPGAEIKSSSGKVTKFNIEDAASFLDNVVIPAVTGKEEDIKIQISGIKGIMDMLPIEINMNSLISKVLDRSNGIYDVYINVRQEIVYGIPRSRIKDALKAVGCRIVKLRPEELYYVSDRVNPYYIRCQAPDDPIKLLSQAYEKLIITKEDGTRIRNYEDPLYQKLHYVHAETDGNNLRDILSIPGIDKRYTISNDLKEVRNVLGIQAARTFIVQELMMVIETLGTKIDPSHIMLIADSMARNHNLLPISHQGTIKNLGPYTNMTFERAADTVMNASRGETEFISSISGQIGTGRVITSGTGSVDVFPNENPEYGLTVPESLNLPKVKVPTSGKITIPSVKGRNSVTAIPSVNKLVEAVSNVPTPSVDVSNILLQRRQVIDKIIENNPEPESCPLVVKSAISYTYNIEDVPIPLIRNRRPDLFDQISKAINLLDVPAKPVLLRPISRKPIPLSKTTAASSLLK